MNLSVAYPCHDRTDEFWPEVPEFLSTLHNRGVAGINVTHPFKERIVELVRVDDSLTSAIGAVNTLRFDPEGPVGFNTDFTGMQEAYRRRFSHRMPGVVGQLGAGGFGRAAAFAMAKLGASQIVLFDPDANKAKLLARHVEEQTGTQVMVVESADLAARSSEGLLNCSPVGMHIHPGCPVNPDAIREVRWVFDAVYAPLKTELLIHAERFGVAAMSGSELFFWQGIHSFEIFTGRSIPDNVTTAAAEVIAAEIELRTREGR
jgi:shikimate dehydrogenase